MKVHKTIKKIHKAIEKGALSRVIVGRSMNEEVRVSHFTVETGDRKALIFLQSMFEGEADRQIRRVLDFGGRVYVEINETHETIQIQTKGGGAKYKWNDPIYFGEAVACN